VGSEQAVLGRFLPDAVGKAAQVVVTGTLAGQPVRYAASFAVPAAEEGNSFLPRLWARKHLDVLLAGGASAETKRQVVELSREYQIMTPYTSFLVLESDEDREKYGVARTVHMRDAEQFFAEARDRAVLEVARKQLEIAKGWRLGLRRRMLREIASLGRDLPIQLAVAWGDANGDGVWLGDRAQYGAAFGRGGGAGGALRMHSRFEGPGGAVPAGAREPSDGFLLYAGDGDNGRGGLREELKSLEFAGSEAEGATAMPAAEAPAPTPAPTTPGSPPPELSPAEDSLEAGEELADNEEADDYAKRPLSKERARASAKDSRRSLSRDDASYGYGYAGRPTSGPSWLAARLPSAPPLTLGGLGVPDLSVPPREEPAEPEDPAWCRPSRRSIAGRTYARSTARCGSSASSSPSTRRAVARCRDGRPRSSSRRDAGTTSPTARAWSRASNGWTRSRWASSRSRGASAGDGPPRTGTARIRRSRSTTCRSAA
jgi:hypothetical protein